jgi:hypothetical protein
MIRNLAFTTKISYFLLENNALFVNFLFMVFLVHSSPDLWTVFRNAQAELWIRIHRIQIQHFK